MGFWFLDNLDWLTREQKAIDKLHLSNDWFIEYEWFLDAQLKLNASFQLGEQVLEVTAIYPDHYPFVPIIVRPLNTNDIWSTHQYLDGTLCLEWGPDTWDTSLTGADMLVSAYHLLEIEQPIEGDIARVAPSRHLLSTGQQLRHKYGRLCVTHSLNEFMKGLVSGTTGTLSLSLQIHKSSSSIIVKSVNISNEELWQDPEIPVGVKETTGVTGLLFCLPSDGFPESGVNNKNELSHLLAKYSFVEIPDEGDSPDIPHVVLLTNEDNVVQGYFVPSDKDDSRIFQEEIVYNESTALNPRLPLKIQSTEELKVGIVGLGSIGSKVAISLARSGFREFILVDHDVLFAENIVRNQLDWLSVTDHKVDAVAANIERIIPKASIKVHKLDLVGQENNSSINNVMNSLSNCDIVVDATCNDSVFNLLSSLYSQNSVPLIWGQVFEGGFGGLVARSRPKQDPPPLTMRRIFLGFCEENPFPTNNKNTRAYEGTIDGKPLVASDAEVGAIASFLTTIAIDTALNIEPSRYPYSLYLIGLSKGWVFDAPFETIPISTTEHLEELSTTEVLAETNQSTLAFLSELIHHAKAKNTDTSANN